MMSDNMMSSKIESKNQFVKQHLLHYLLSKSLAQQTANHIFKVAILGVESTGKTTLCKDLAQHFGTDWVLEFTRPYLEQKMAVKQLGYDWEDLMIIARGQMALENQTAANMSQASWSSTQSDRAGAPSYLFCDTTLFELMVYAYWYYGKCPIEIEKAALAHHYDLILLTEIDVPWEADALRDSPKDRDRIDAALVTALKRHNKPFKRIGGDRQTRINKVTHWLNEMTLIK